MTDPRIPLTEGFFQAMGRLGPFEPAPSLAVAVSGGADSMALALLTRDWVRQRGGAILALVVDHGLRAASGDEACVTIERLHEAAIPARLLRLSNLKHGPALADRARIARYDALTVACRDAGILHLLLGHHARDQVETLAMRVLRGSQTRGLAGMPALRETAQLRLLRPLLGIEPALLRASLTASATDWVEDPSNQDLRATRPRMRHGLTGVSPTDTGLQQALTATGKLRQREEAATAAELARRATIRPEGFAVLSPGRIGEHALAALVQTIGGAPYPPSPSQIAELAARPKPATVAGVRLLPAGRFGEGLLVVREESAIGPDIAATNGALWDGRFRLRQQTTAMAHAGPTNVMIGKLGDDAARFRRSSKLPSAVLRTVPAVRCGEVLAFVPHLGYAGSEDDRWMTILFSPGRPLAGPCFLPAA